MVVEPNDTATAGALSVVLPSAATRHPMDLMFLMPTCGGGPIFLLWLRQQNLHSNACGRAASEIEKMYEGRGLAYPFSPPTPCMAFKAPIVTEYCPTIHRIDRA